jgi:hypothetical protein
MPIPIPTDQYPTLIELINETYLDRVEQITAAELADNEDLICVAIDGRKKLAVKVADAGISIKLMGGKKAVGVAKFSTPGKKKTCSNGISCGATCISASKVCQRELTPKQVQVLASLRQLVKAGSPVAQKQIDGIKIGQLNKTRLANEKAKKAAMSEIEKIVDESNQQMAESRKAAKLLIEEVDSLSKDLSKKFGQDLSTEQGKLSAAKSALEQASKDISADKLKQSKDAIDKAFEDDGGDDKETVAPEKSALERVLEANPGLKPHEAKLKAGTIDKLEKRLASDDPSPADKAYRDALLQKEDPDSSEAALDRVNSLFNTRNRQEKGDLTDGDVQDVVSDFGQGLRGGSVQDINEATAKYTAEIWGNLTPKQRGQFAETWLERATLDQDISTALKKSSGFQKARKAKDVDKFTREADEEIRRKLAEREEG